MRALLRFILLLSVALLPLTSFAARAGTPADLTSSAIELEQAASPGPAQKTAPAQEHRHCTLWAAEAAACMAPPGGVPAKLAISVASAAPRFGLAAPDAPTPPPKR